MNLEYLIHICVCVTGSVSVDNAGAAAAAIIGCGRAQLLQPPRPFRVDCQCSDAAAVMTPSSLRTTDEFGRRSDAAATLPLYGHGGPQQTATDASNTHFAGALVVEDRLP